ncbi:YbbR-like domain-containing protein [candidate division KSB1 bacterium]|nr:YbbR-like domain-containing protein [candidate division KSB1 bacterium]
MNIRNLNLNIRWRHLWQRYRTHIAASGVAIIIWFLVISNGTFDYEVTIPIDMPTLPQHLSITSELPSEAKIKVRGQGLALLALIIFSEGKMEFTLDCEPGQKTIYPSTDDVLLIGSAKNLTVLQIIDPAEIILQIEPIESRTCPVKNNLLIKPAPGYTVVGEISLSPDKVTIRGGQSLIKKIDSVQTEVIVWQELVKPLTRQVHLVQPLKNQRIILDPPTITIQADVQKLMEKRILNIPINVTNLPAGMRAIVIPAQLSLIAEGGVQIVANLTGKDIIAYIDYRRYQEQKTPDFPAYIKPVPWVRYRDIEPKRFKVVLEKM